MSKARDLANAGTALGAVTATELGYVDGVTSAIQTQIDGKQAINANVSTTELGYLDGVTSAVQTQLDAKTAKNTLTTTGDIYYASAANTPARLGIGSSAQVLTVVSGIPTWAAPSGATASYVQIATSGTLSGSSYTFSSISGYSQLYLRIDGVSSDAASFYAQVQLNGDTTTKYSNYGTQSTYDSPVGATKIQGWTNTSDTSIYLGQSTTAGGTFIGYLYLNGCNSTGIKMGTQIIGGNAVNQGYFISGTAQYTGTSTISSVTVKVNSGAFDAGYLTLFGSVA